MRRPDVCRQDATGTGKHRPGISGTHPAGECRRGVLQMEENTMRTVFVGAALAALLFAQGAPGQSLCVTGFNAESGDSTTEGLTKLVRRHADCGR